MDVLISIIIPVFNAQRTIVRCLESCVHQKYTGIEVIVVDDGSNDESLHICNEYAKKYSWINAIHKENGGVSSARNFGLKFCTGKYVVFLDSDDYIDNYAAYNFMEAVKSSKAELVIGSYKNIRKNVVVNAVVCENRAILNNAILEDFSLIDSMMSTPWGKLYSISVIRSNNIEFDNDLTIGEDHCFNIEYMKHVRSVLFIEKNVYYYSLGGVLSTQHYHNNIDSMYITLLDKYSEYFGKYEIKSDWINNKAGELFLAVADHYLICLTKVKATEKIEVAFIRFSKYDISNYLKNNLMEEEIRCLYDMQFENFVLTYWCRKYVFFVKKKILRKARMIIG